MKSYKFWIIVLIAAVVGALALVLISYVIFFLLVFLSFSDWWILHSIFSSWVGLIITVAVLIFTFVRTFLGMYKVLVRRFW